MSALAVTTDIDGRGVLRFRGEPLGVWPSVDDAWEACKGVCREFDRLVQVIPTNALEAMLEQR